MKQHVAPSIDGAWQTPVHAVDAEADLLVRPVPVLAGVSVAPHLHHLADVQQHEPPWRRRARRGAELLHLSGVERGLRVGEARLAAPHGPRPEAVPAVVPLAVLVVRRRHGPEAMAAVVSLWLWPRSKHVADRRLRDCGFIKVLSLTEKLQEKEDAMEGGATADTVAPTVDVEASLELRTSGGGWGWRGGGGGSALTWTFGAAVKRTGVQSGCRRSRGQTGRVGFGRREREVCRMETRRGCEERST
jgi:hypothetical protein